jgi:hypothetical protein
MSDAEFDWVRSITCVMVSVTASPTGSSSTVQFAAPLHSRIWTMSTAAGVEEVDVEFTAFAPHFVVLPVGETGTLDAIIGWDGLTSRGGV